jgi:hypothetical protein
MSTPQLITLSLSIVIFAAGVVLSGLSARRDNERRMIQEAATEMCEATSNVISHLKALERRPATAISEERRDQLERALHTVAAAHARFRLAAGLRDPVHEYPRHPSEWSQVLSRASLRIGATILEGQIPCRFSEIPGRTNACNGCWTP